MKPGYLLRSKSVSGHTVVILSMYHCQFVYAGELRGHTCLVIYPDAQIHTIGIVPERWEVIGGS